MDLKESTVKEILTKPPQKLLPTQITDLTSESRHKCGACNTWFKGSNSFSDHS